MRGDRMEDFVFVFGVSLAITGVCLLFVILGSGSGMDIEKRRWQKEAVEKGHGEFVITDKKTGKSEFRWKEGGR